jgi:hypothetical protein
MPKTSVSQKVKQSQKVTVNIGSTKQVKKSKRRPKSAPVREAPPYVRYPNSIGYALNSQVYAIPQPKMLDYNSALSGMKALQAQQMKTGSLIPNQQVNSLYSTIRATPRQESLGDNPFTRPTRNNQMNMVDPYEGELENIIEYNTVEDVYDPDPNGQISVGVGQTLGDLPAGIVQVGASEELLLDEMSKGLKGETRSLGDRQSVASTINPQLSEKAFSDVVSTLKYYDDANLEESLGKSTKKAAAMGAIIGYPAPYFTPEKSTSKRGRPKGSSNKKVILGGIEMDEL